MKAYLVLYLFGSIVYDYREMPDIETCREKALQAIVARDDYFAERHGEPIELNGRQIYRVHVSFVCTNRRPVK